MSCVKNMSEHVKKDAFMHAKMYLCACAKHVFQHMKQDV